MVEPCIDAEQPGIIRSVLTRGKYTSDRRRSAEITADPRDGEQRPAAGRAVSRVVGREDRRDVPLVRLPRELRTSDRGRDLTGVDELSRRVEQLEAVEKKRTFFRVEQGEPFVERDLADVGLDLREVRIDRCVERQVLTHAPA